MKTFGENLRKIRKLNKLSQKEFAKLMHTSQQRISEWECGKVEPSLFKLMRILKILDVTFEEIVEGTDLNDHK